MLPVFSRLKSKLEMICLVWETAVCDWSSLHVDEMSGVYSFASFFKMANCVNFLVVYTTSMCGNH